MIGGDHLSEFIAMEKKLAQIEEKCVYTITMREDMPYSEVHAILDLIREKP